MTTPNIEELMKILLRCNEDGSLAEITENEQKQTADALQSQAERIKTLEGQSIEVDKVLARENVSLRATLEQIAATEPVAYLYEMATAMMTPGNYSGWVLKLEYQKPCVPEGAVRNLQELFTRPMPAQRCTYCDGTGDVHSIDGEWRGKCPCAQDVTELVDALERLARLGNGDQYGNMIARDALSKYKGAK